MFALLLMLGLATGAEPPAETSHATHSVWLWQGFSHMWERRALGLFTVPHRVSLFRSVVRDDGHVAEGDHLVSTGVFSLGQSTGVDGDRMAAKGYASVLHAPGIWVDRGQLSFETTDEVVELDRAPHADATFDAVVQAPLPATADADWSAVLVLQGVEFHSSCEGDQGECNSDGVWPYRFKVELGACEVLEDVAECPVEVLVGRAWTPGHGGVRGIEVKPLNDRMTLAVDVAWAVVAGPKDALASQNFTFENSLRSTQEIVAQTQQMTVPGLSRDHSTATVALTALAFEFFPTRLGGERRHRGRYVGGWGVRVEPGELRQAQGELDVQHAGGIFLPRTVQKTGVSLSIGMAVLQVEDADAFVSETLEVTADLCANSAGAPWFSKWNRCGVEQIEVDTPLLTTSPVQGHEARTGAVPESGISPPPE
ncbi:MAG: hypothetical protein KC912_20490 [Proteobacteria bacterium]|nr:hypothetical protein [Pseudomonadota bacterium]